MNILGTLMSISVTLVWSILLSALAVFLYFAIKTLQGQQKKSTVDRFQQLRTVLFVAPLIWVFLNFTSDANHIARVMFGLWLPFVIFGILLLGIAELALPVWYHAKKTGGRMGRMAKGGRRR